MKNSDASRRRFFQSAVGAWVVSSSLASPDTQAADQPGAIRVANPVSGDVLRTSGALTADGRQFMEQQRTIPV